MKKLFNIIGLALLLSTSAIFATEISAEQKANSLYSYLTQLALKNGSPAKEDQFTFTQDDIGKISYYLSYYLFSVEDLYKTENVFATTTLEITDKNFADTLYLLRSFIDVGKTMRKYVQFNRMKCRYLYGAFQERALKVTPERKMIFKDYNDEKYVPTFTGGCWDEPLFPERYFPNYKTGPI